MNPSYPKRLIEVDLPIRRISAHARREKDMRRGHVPLLHIWPATRPPAACRAVISAMLWPDPVDVTAADVLRARRDGGDAQLNTCPPLFREKARECMLEWTSHERQALLSIESRARFEALRRNPKKLEDSLELRHALLDFIADFANPDNATNNAYLRTSRELTSIAHEALGGAAGTRPLVVDPFAGGGAIPLEALRVGADAFASDLNPVAILIEKTVLEYLPKFGQRLIDAIEREVESLSKHARAELNRFYPSSDRSLSTAYIWARTIACEGPACGCKVPLIRSQILVRKPGRVIAVRFTKRCGDGSIGREIVESSSLGTLGGGTVRRGGATCPICGYTTSAASVRRQLKELSGGAADATLIAVVEVRDDKKGRHYRQPTEQDFAAIRMARQHLDHLINQHGGALSLVPNEPLHVMSGVFNAPIYGHSTWGSLFTPRQAIYLSTCSSFIAEVILRVRKSETNEFAEAVGASLALVFDKMADMNSALCGWQAHAEIPAHTFARWALPMVWDFAETNPLAESSGSPESALKRTMDGLRELLRGNYQQGTVQQCSASAHPLPDDSASLIVTDPPYYNAVPYADLSDYFYTWLRRVFVNSESSLFTSTEAPKDAEICEMSGWDPDRYRHKDAKWYEEQMRKAMEESRRVLAPDGLGMVVFAHKSTRGWEAQLQAMIDAGWVVTGSWPIDTEMASRMRAMNSAVLASSVHLVCRPRENHGRSIRTDEIGDWRDVLQQLPRRIHEWMPRLAEEGVVGADAIFACLGPALEVYSRYKRVERADGEQVSLREYLEHVWAAVSKEALSMVFEGADATGFEEDSRLTAMWLWTLNAGVTDVDNDADEDESPDDGDDKPAKGRTKSGFTLEYDAARKIAQGLGAHLEDLNHLVEISGETARLLPVSERATYLFGKDQASAPNAPKGRKKDDQLKFDLFQELTQSPEPEVAWSEKTVTKPGETTLDRVHQSMILFAAGRSEALRRFLVDDGAGKDQRFWRLAQALSALFPKASEEKRWIDGVLARKKGLGL